MRDTLPREIFSFLTPESEVSLILGERDNLPNKTNDKECGIVNLDSSKNHVTHWGSYYKDNEKSYYFNPFGLDPPIEIRNYLKSNIELSTFQIQTFKSNDCGYYCLLVLKRMEKHQFKDIILNLSTKAPEEGQGD